MSDTKLSEAIKYERENEKNIPESERPGFHFTPRVGWCNDPNGFCYYDGKYHLFYQYHPYSPFWGPMHWGHAVSDDMIKWEYLPCAMAPDTEADNKGVFSGSAITLKDGRHLLMYTGVSSETQPDGKTRDIQTQCVAVGDGLTYTKYEHNPVITSKDMPEEYSKFDFRDPKLIYRDDGKLGVVLVTCNKDFDGRAIMFVSDDGFSWKFDREIIRNDRRFGTMWECPDYFTIDGKNALIVSPMEMLKEGYEHASGHGTVCLLGKDNGSQDGFDIEYAQALDYGMDFYAPQTLEMKDGRRALIAWMQNWSTSGSHSGNLKLYGQMTLVRELTYKEGRLYQTPLKEFESYRKNPVHIDNAVIAGETSLEGISGRHIDLDCTLDIDKADPCRAFKIKICADDKFDTTITYTPEDGVVTLDRKNSGVRFAGVHDCSCQIAPKDREHVSLRMIIDRNCVELYINGGAYVMSALINTPVEADKITFSADKNTKVNIEKYDIA